jgi:hypothetical protein
MDRFGGITGQAGLPTDPNRSALTPGNKAERQTHVGEAIDALTMSRSRLQNATKRLSDKLQMVTRPAIPSGESAAGMPEGKVQLASALICEAVFVNNEAMFIEDLISRIEL